MKKLFKKFFASIKTEAVDHTQEAEELFHVYEETRSLNDLYPLYEIGIYLHELKDGNSTKERREITTVGKRLVKMYDKINGKMTFTKILVY